MNTNNSKPSRQTIDMVQCNNYAALHKFISSAQAVSQREAIMFEQVFNASDISKTQQQFQQRTQQAAALNTDVLKKLTRHNVESGTELVAGAMQHAEKLRAVKQPAEFVQLQSEYFQAATAYGRNHWLKFAEILADSSEQYKAMWETSVDSLKDEAVKEVKTSRRKKS